MSGRAPSVVAAVRRAFAPGGPVQQRMGQHRPLQAEFAVGLAEHVENHTSDDDIRPWIQAQRSGIGKTLGVGVVLGIDALLNNRSSIISTHTRALRTGYLDTLEDVNNILRATLGRRARPLRMAAYLSGTEWFSPSKMEALRARRTAGITTDPESQEMLDYYDETLDHGDDPTFDGYFEAGFVLPNHTTRLHWALCPTDRDTPLAQSIRDGNIESEQADLLLVTHAMLIQNSIAKGDVLRTALELPDAAPTHRGILLVDEADKLPPVAYAALTWTISHNVLINALGDITAARPATSHGRLATDEGVDLIRDGLAFMAGWMKDHEDSLKPLVIDRTHSLAPAVVLCAEQITAGLERLRDVARGRYSDDDRDDLMADHIQMLLTEARRVSEFTLQIHRFAKLEINPYRDDDDELDVKLTVNLGSGRSLISEYWSPETRHTFSGVAMISASLTDLPPNFDAYTWFSKVIGLLASHQSITLPPIPRDPRYTFGRIREVVVADRTLPHPTDTSQPKNINPEFTYWCSTALGTLATLQREKPATTRMLVLFPSYSLIDAVWETMPELHDRIVRMRRGANLRANIRQYAELPHGIWFGTEWEGVNFVDPRSHRTLVNMLVVTRIPQPPNDAIRVARISDWFDSEVAAERRGEALELRENNVVAFHKLTQGVGRGLRNAEDMVDLLAILDIRFPVPPNVSAGGTIATSGGDPTKMFGRFHHILLPYGVRRWSVMDSEGTITRVL